MKELLEQGLGVGMVGTVTGIGVIVRIILFGYYTRLGKACKQFEKTNNRTITYIREELDRRTRRNLGIKNATVYTECRLTECKVCGVRVGILECMMQQSLLIVPLSGVLTAFAGVISECKGLTIWMPLFACGVAVLTLLLMDLITGMREKYKRIRLTIRDYVENWWALQADEEETVPEPARKDRKTVRKERKAEKRAGKRAEKGVRKADKPKCAATKKNGKAQEEKRRLTEELLRERRQLEARSLAQQRKKAQEEVSPEPQVQEEATVSVCPVSQVQEEATVGISPEPQVQEEAAVSVCPEPQVQEEAAVSVCPEPQVQEEVAVSVCPVQQIQEETAKTQEFSYEELLSEVLAEYLA